MTAINKKVDVIAVERGERSLLFGVDSLTVVRGKTELVHRARDYLMAGPERAHQNGPTKASLDRVLSTFLDAPAERGLPQRVNSAVTRLNVGNTYHCNMGCTYCYNELSNKDRKGSEVDVGMSLETGRAMVDALLAQSTDEPLLSLVFIGGEALLDKRTLFAIVEYARARCGSAGKVLDVCIYTNGVLMDKATVEWANRMDVDLVVSLDGPPEINDRHRVFLNGRPSSGPVLRNIRQWMELSTRRWRRVNAVASGVKTILPIAKYLLELGFNDIHIQTAYGEDGFGERGNTQDVVELFDWYRALLISGTVVAVAPFASVLYRLVAAKQSLTSFLPCTTGYSSLGVGPDGRVYPCHHFLEEDEFRLGDVRAGLPDATQRVSLVHEVEEREPCRSCWARFACGGECYHRAHTAGRGYDGVIREACDGRRLLIGLTLELFADLAAQRPDVLMRLAAHDYSQIPVHDSAYEARDLSAYGYSTQSEARRVSLPILNLSR